jgi:hypothetical protein
MFINFATNNDPKLFYLFLFLVPKSSIMRIMSPGFIRSLINKEMIL